MISVPFRLPGLVPAVLAGLLIAAPASAQRTALFEDEAKSPWQEVEMPFPAYPTDASLIPLQVGPTATAASSSTKISAWPPMASCASRSWCAPRAVPRT
jgi:hypothetical protein